MAKVEKMCQKKKVVGSQIILLPKFILKIFNFICFDILDCFLYQRCRNMIFPFDLTIFNFEHVLGLNIWDFETIIS